MRFRHTIVAASLFILILFLLAIPGFSQTKVSKPGEYSGYSQVMYPNYVRTSVYVPGHDGTKLAVDIYRPSMDGTTAANQKFPALLTSHPASSRRNNTTGRDLVPYGYVVVVLDLRGIGASFGQHHGDFNVDERFDLKAVIEWIAAQEWCTGNVGMLGNSYSGSIQHLAATAEPPHLLSIHPSSAAFDTYKQFYPNGVSALPTVGPPPISLSGVPVDEDTPPDYPLLQAAIASHTGSTGELNWRVPGMFRDAWSNDTQNRPLIDHSPQTYSLAMKNSGVKMYQIAGWYDHHLDEQLIAFNTFGNKAIVGPWTHAMTDAILNVEKLRWLDYSLKGIQNGILDEPPIYYYTSNAPAGQNWRFGPGWPLPNQEMKHFFFSGDYSGTVASVNDGTLSNNSPAVTSAQDNYLVDYNISLFNGAYRRDRRNFAGDMTPSPDQKGLTYTTEPLGADTEVTGNPIVRLWVNSTISDGHFLAFLEEVDSDGFSHYVTDGVIRASFRKIQGNFTGKPTTLPVDLNPADLWNAVGIPYHRGFEADYSPLNGTPTELVFELISTSYVFRKGNRIRLTVICGHKEFYQYPTGIKVDPAPTVYVYRDAAHPSSLALPVIPAKATIFEGTARVNTLGVAYNGPANLYVWKTATYLSFDGKWLKWNIDKNWTAGITEQFKGASEEGPINVVVTNNTKASFEALATGNGIHFKGTAKY
jgi:uncharacterized protein